MALCNQSLVDNFLTDRDELDNFMTRQLAFRNFQRSFFGNQTRQSTTEGLAYISRLQIDDVSLALVGLDSAWLSGAGGDDHGNLLIGEMQVINAMRSVLECVDMPNIVIAFAHHPFHLLREFDYLSIQARVERSAHFFHYGHLHQAGTRMADPMGSKCLSIGAGASYTTRHDFNAYSIVELDLLRAVRSVRSFVYDPGGSRYSLAENQQVFPIEIMPTSLCSVGELAAAIENYDANCEQYAYYVAALILGQKSDFPVPDSDPPVFASIDVVQSLPDSDLKILAIDLGVFRNVLKVLYGRKRLDRILRDYGDMLGRCAAVLGERCIAVPSLEDRIDELNEDARRIAGLDPLKTFKHTHDLFSELAEYGEWELLNAQAKRHVGSDDVSLARQARSMRALALANVGGSENKLKAIECYRSLSTGERAQFNDVRNLVVLLTEVERFDEALCTLFSGIELFPERRKAFLDIGQTIVGITGDKQLRVRLDCAARGGA